MWDLVDELEKTTLVYKKNSCESDSRAWKKNMVVHKICILLKERYYSILIRKKSKIIDDYSNIFGCTERQLANHLEKLFKDKMAFNNHGKWEVDHIFPVSKCDVEDIENIHKCFHYTNLQPLWKTENRLKSDKIV